MAAWSLTTLRRFKALLCVAMKKFLHIDGPQRAAAFAYNAFFSLFPLLILLAAAASLFVSKTTAGNAVISYTERYVPLTGEARHYIFDTVYHTVKTRSKAGFAAFIILIWVSSQFFTTLVQAANRAWGTVGDKWWHLPLDSLSVLAVMTICVLLGISLPVIVAMLHSLFTKSALMAWIYGISVTILPSLIVFFSLSLFYKMAPRRRTQFSEVWLAAICGTVLLQVSQTLFVIYLKKFSSFNAVYGAFGSVMALLLWIYLSGCIFIFCACLCSAQAEMKKQLRG